jgi:hypothetical protein
MMNYLAVRGVDEQSGYCGHHFLYPHFSRGIIDQLIDHVGSGSAIRSMALIRIAKQGPGEIGA